MAFSICPICGGTVTSGARLCPHCREPFLVPTPSPSLGASPPLPPPPPPPVPEPRAAVNEASEKPERIWPVTWAAIIVASGTVLLLLWALVFRSGSAPQPVSQEADEQTSWKDYPLAELIEAGEPPIGVSPERFEQIKSEAKEVIEKRPGMEEHQRKFEQLILDWVDDHQGQPLPEQEVMSGWIQEMRADKRKEFVATPEIQSCLARMKQLESPECPEFAALQHEFERLTLQWTLRQMDADKLLADFDRKYQQWLQDSHER